MESFYPFALHINNPQSINQQWKNHVILFIYFTLYLTFGVASLSTTIQKLYRLPTGALFTGHDFNRLHNRYLPQENYFLWNSYNHIILDYSVVLPHSSFLSINISFKDHVSVNQKTVAGHTENPLHWSRVNLTYFQRFTLKK